MQKKLIGGEWYVLYSDVVANIRKLTLKEHDSFVVVDQNGEIPCQGTGELGFYNRDTRLLSGFEFFINDQKPIFLSSDIGNLGAEIRVILTNPDMEIDGELFPRSSIYIQKSFALLNDDLWSNFYLQNFSQNSFRGNFSFCIKADFRNIFEVRGQRRKRRGKTFSPAVGETFVNFKYEGLDKITRQTIFLSSQPLKIAEVSTNEDSACVKFTLEIVLAPGQTKELTFLVARVPRELKNYSEVIKERREKLLNYLHRIALITTNNERINEIFSRSAKDLNLMITETDKGLIAYAGVPWFSTIFGRDSIITAYQLLPWYPDLAGGTLKVLAFLQGTKFDDFTDQEPGKILHEWRQGEMANTREIPFIPYYGSVDSTPLFLILAWKYYRVTGDLELLNALKENLIAAYQWLTNNDFNPNISREGFLFYQRRSPIGLENQGWKDSGDAVFYSNGKLAKPPLALIEVQGYKYLAQKAAAVLFSILEEYPLAEKALKEAEKFPELIKQYFFVKRGKFFAMAIDRKSRKCAIRTSNMGHLLFAEAVSKKDAELITSHLFSKEMFSGIGIRTLAEGEKRYNPISYHNGSVWPHDNSIIGEGLAKYGFKKEAAKLLMGLLNAAIYFPNFRIPELIGGFEITKFHGPVPYPTACSPQAWASGSIFLLIKAILGLEVDGLEKVIHIKSPFIPEELQVIEIKNLPLPSGEADMVIRKIDRTTSVELLKKPRGWRVEIG